MPQPTFEIPAGTPLDELLEIVGFVQARQLLAEEEAKAGLNSARTVDRVVYDPAEKRLQVYESIVIRPPLENAEVYLTF